MALEVLPFDKKFDRRSFDCGVSASNRYLTEQSGQDVRRNYATLFVAVDVDTAKVLGFYTLSSASIGLSNLSAEVAKKLPKYPDVPAIRLGRLAVDLSARGTGLGGKLIADAVIRSVNNVAGWAVMVVDAKDAAVSFYKRFGFAALGDDEKHLFIMRDSLAALLTPRSQAHLG